MEAEYNFDYNRAKPNRFATPIKEGGRRIVLDPDVAAAFTSSEMVNAVLRALLRTMPRTTSKLPGVGSAV